MISRLMKEQAERLGQQAKHHREQVDFLMGAREVDPAKIQAAIWREQREIRRIERALERMAEVVDLEVPQ